MNSTVILLVFTLCFGMAFLAAWISIREKSNRLFNSDGEPASSSVKLLGAHIAGIFWLGLVPLFLFTQTAIPLLTGAEFPDIYWLISFSVVFVLIALAGNRSGRQVHLRYQNSNLLTGKFVNLYFPVRILFLASYEFFFRGILLFDLNSSLGIYPAILISTGLTVLIHVFHDRREMWGCLPFGIILGALCISIHAVWPAIVLHITLSMFYEIPPVTRFFSQLKPTK